MPARFLSFHRLLLTLGAIAMFANALQAEALHAPAKWHPGHYVFVGHGAIRDDLIALPQFRGIQRCYSWAKLEPERGRYDFSAIRDDLARLRAAGKQLVLQIQYKAFGQDRRDCPAYLQGPEFGGGVYRASSGSWDPVLWNAPVGERMAALYAALGREFDAEPGVEAAVLPETSPSAQLEKSPQPGVEAFTVDRYVAALERQMLALRRAFPNTAVIQYTNFPQSALPALIAYMKEIGVGLGGPDVYPGQSALSDPQKGIYRFYAPLAGTVPLGAAVQSPDYSVANWKRTAAFNRGQDRASAAVTAEEEKPIPAREHLRLAHDTLRLNYLFWSASPKEHFARVAAMLAEPDLAADPAGGLHAAIPARAFATAHKP